MRTVVALGFLSMCSMAFGGPAPPARRTAPIGADEGVFQYHFEKGALGFDDIVRLKDRSQQVGKAMEWADQVLLFDGQGRATSFDVSNVKDFELRPSKRNLIRPQLPDLTVAYVERLPRDPSWQGHVAIEGGTPKADVPGTGVAWHPAPGAAVTFRAHVLNAGPVKSVEVGCTFSVDGKPIATTKLQPLDAWSERTLDASWSWQEGAHVLRVEIDPAAAQQEIVRWNNTFEEPVQALAMAAVVARDRYEAFHKTPNLVDSFCFEDWLQYQIRCMNGLFMASTYATAPHGVLERVRVDRIIVTDDSADAAHRAEWESQLRQGGRRDGWLEESAVVTFEPLAANETATYAARKVDWAMLKRLGRELGLVDLRATDTRVDQCLVPDRGDRYVARQQLFPWPRTLMHSPGGFPLDEASAGYLNAALGKPRGFSGEYLYQLPRKMTLEIRSSTGATVEGVQVDAYQLQSGGDQAGYIAGIGRDPLYSASTGADGRLDLPDIDAPPCKTPNGYELRPNPFGKIATDGSNGLLLFRLRHTHEEIIREEFHFLRLFDCNVICLRGQSEHYVHVLQTRFPDAAAPTSPPYLRAVADDSTDAKPPSKLRWRTRAPLIQLEEFRLYQRIGLGGEDETPWTLSSVVRKSGKKWVMEVDAPGFEPPFGEAPYTPDTFLAITAVDRNGRESGLSNPTFQAFDSCCVKFAIDTEAAFITMSGGGPVRMLRWDASAPPQPLQLNTSSFKRYRPACAGIAVTPEHRLIVSDPLNHVLAVYDLNGNLEDVIPRREWWPGFPSKAPGEFYDPADVAVDKQGRIYVADRGNDRVQILDGQGKYLGLVDSEFPFSRPHSAACSNGRLCVTDNVGTRVRVYNIEGSEPKFERQLPTATDVDRAVVAKSGKIYATGLDPDSKKHGMLIFAPEGQSAKFESAVFSGEMGNAVDPRGAYVYDYDQDQYVYVVNKFPIDVRRFKLE